MSLPSVFRGFRALRPARDSGSGRLAALDRSQGVIEFSPQGEVRDANANFLAAFGCRLADVLGKHHRMFMPAGTTGAEYGAFWARLAKGEFQSGRFRRVRPDGREVWLQATYNPVRDDAGRVTGVVKFATDVTAQVHQDADAAGQLAAIDRAMAVIEFELDGTVRRANANFLAVMGYDEAEVVGRPHSMFVDAETAASDAYAAFWADLNAGEFRRGQFRRIAKGGRDVWIEATYNPILDAEGRPCKVVKYASDVTAQRNRNADFESQMAAIHKVQAVIEFDLQGTIVDANPNFLESVGYTREEVVGRHHSMFVEPADANSAVYRDFWKRLARGEADSGRYRRRGNGGREIWLRASYSPILDGAGRPYKVVKYATDVTAQVRLAEELKLLVARVEQLSGGISTGAREIADGNADLSTRTEQQSAALEETAATMEQMSAAVTQTAGNAHAAADLTRSAMEAAQAGGIAMDRLVDAIGAIRQASNKSMDILSVIDAIAFQTNILALNAAVEAARAGEQGRGFAVVAGEVRALAQRCAQSAKEIKQNLSASSEGVAVGVERVREAGDAMRAIVAAVEATARVVEEIGVASREQSQGIGQVNSAIQNMEEVVQQNAALVEEVAACSTELDRQARELHEAVDGFAAREATSTRR